MRPNHAINTDGLGQRTFGASPNPAPVMANVMLIQNQAIFSDERKTYYDHGYFTENKGDGKGS